MRFDELSAILLAALLSLGCGSALGADIYVIAGPDVILSPEDVRELYLGDKEFSGQVRLVPVDNQAALSEFVVKALGMNPRPYTTLGSKKAFRDAFNPPSLKPVDSEVLSFVRVTSAAFAYVYSARPT